MGRLSKISATYPLSLLIKTLVLLTFLHLSCQKTEEQRPVETTVDLPNESLFRLMNEAETGIAFQNNLPENDQFNILSYEYYYNGAGVAAGDVNNDGLTDIFFSANLVSNRLYLNQGNFQFKEVTQATGIVSRPGWKTGVSMVDINHDGFLDIYICRSGNLDEAGRANELFINQGNGKFIEEAEKYGLADPGYSIQASFFDYDRDGDLDMYLLNHALNPDPNFNIAAVKNERHPYFGDKLFRNDDGKFTDISEKAGIKGNPIGFGLSVTVGDINGDGWQDIFVGNDYIEQDYLYINNQDGTFSDKLEDHFAHTSKFSMGSDMADINNDARPDLFVIDMLPEDNYGQKILKGADNYDRYQQQVSFGFYHQYMRNTLQLNLGNGHFSEIGQLAGVSNTDWSWGAIFADWDNDGFKDLYITNGHVRVITHLDFIKYTYPEAQKKAREAGVILKDGDVSKQIPTIRISNYGFKNNGKLGFENQTSTWGLDRPSFSSGLAYADLDNDGDLDLIVNNINENAFIYQNQSEKINENHFLKIKLEGKGKNPRAIGAKVTISYGDQKQYQEFIPVKGYQSSMEPILHFGLGSVNMVDKVEIEWPDGTYSSRNLVPADSFIYISQEKLTPKPTETEISPIFTELNPNQSVSFSHRKSEFVDFRREPLLPHMFSKMGTCLAVGDVNGDGLEDIFAGGGKNQSSQLFIQQKNGRFQKRSLKDNPNSQPSDAVFFDADGDKDLDLYIANGGNEFEFNDKIYEDVLFLNNGRGSFSKAKEVIPSNTNSNGCVSPADFDGDGDLDLFVGGRVIPGAYPQSPRSYLLRNDGGTFTDVTHEWNSDLEFPGLVSDAIWADLDKNGTPDLILAGEWMPISIFINQGNKLGKLAQTSGLAQTHGWWNKLEVSDLDLDGDLDIIAGNLGLNTQLKAGPNQPASVIAKDFDNNGLIDPVISYYIQGKNYPIATRDELLNQLNFLKKRFQYYDQYARATTTEIFTPQEAEGVLLKLAYQFSTAWFENVGDGTFITHPLPIEAQFAPVWGIAVDDFNKDNHPDILLNGNFYPVRAETGRYDAGRGLLLTGNGKGQFSPLSVLESGFYTPGDVRDLKLLKGPENSNLVLVGKNGGQTQVFSYRK